MKIFHSYHIVEKRPWPFLVSFILFNLVLILGNLFAGIFEKLFFYFRVFILLFRAGLWWRDVIREALFLGSHTLKVKKGLKIGIVLFIVREIFFFFSFFWSYFYYCFSPGIEVGLIWPPMGLESFNAYRVPLLNTIILLRSGLTVTWAHFELLQSCYEERLQSLKFTVVLGVYFLIIQCFEYKIAIFSIRDSVYGSIFFLATGFHGIHVFVGVLFLLVRGVRLKNNHFSNKSHLNFEVAAWYWHFVDVVWLFLYVFVYWFFY